MTKKSKEDIPEVIEQEIRKDFDDSLGTLKKLGIISEGKVTNVEAIPQSTDDRIVANVIIARDIVTVRAAHEIKVEMILGPPAEPRWWWYLVPWKWKGFSLWRVWKNLGN